MTTKKGTHTHYSFNGKHVFRQNTIRLNVERLRYALMGYFYVNMRLTELQIEKSRSVSLHFTFRAYV